MKKVLWLLLFPVVLFAQPSQFSSLLTGYAVITGCSVNSSNVAIFTTSSNTLSAGQVPSFTGLSNCSFLNNTVNTSSISVSSTGLSNTGFQVTGFTHAAVSFASESNAFASDATDLTCGGTLPCSTWPMPANPGMGNSWTDTTYGTTTWELPVGAANTYGHVVPTYARVQAFSEDNHYLFMSEGGGSNTYAYMDLYDATTTPPTFINRMTTSDGTDLNSYNGDANWAFSSSTPTRIYYIPWGGYATVSLQLRYVDVGGGNCTTSSCVLTPTIVHSFSCTTDSYTSTPYMAGPPLGTAGTQIETGSGAQGGMFDSTDNYFSFSCDYLNGGDRDEIDLIRYNKSANTTFQEKWYNVCPGAVPTGCYVWTHYENPASPGVNMYRFNQHPNQAYIEFGWQATPLNTNSDWNSSIRAEGTEAYGPTYNYLGTLSVGNDHSDTGYDINGYPVFVALNTNNGTQVNGGYPDYYSLEVTRLDTLSTTALTSKQLQLPCTWSYVGTPCPNNPFLQSKEYGPHVSGTGSWGSVPGYFLLSNITLAGYYEGFPIDWPPSTSIGTAVASAGTATVTPASMSTIGAGTQQTVDWVSTFVESPGSIGSGVQTITPYSMTGITVGQTLTVGNQTVTVSSTTSSTFTATFPSSVSGSYITCPNMETITVTSVTPTTFTATFAHAHAVNAAVANLTAGDTGPYALENDAVLIDTTAPNASIAHVWRLGRVMSIRDGCYNAEAHTFVNRDWTAYVWGSDWNVDPGGCTAVPNLINSYYTKLSGATSYTLTVSTTTGTGSGTINITNNCQTGSFTSGTTIGPCTATPDGGSVFAGWTGTLGCTGTGTCTASLTGNSTMNAVFNLAPTSVPAAIQGTGSIQGTAVIQ